MCLFTCMLAHKCSNVIVCVWAHLFLVEHSSLGGKRGRNPLLYMYSAEWISLVAKPCEGVKKKNVLLQETIISCMDSIKMSTHTLES